ncbi:amino acid permease [Variovorax sp. LjRoot84]|uniref:APC family permease n=1 Tax=Variovorax sp. LjRoot84 TaxID=3342340 RepID=UPI003ED0046E
MTERLQKNVTLPHGVGLAVSTIIGSGLLGLPGLAIGQAGAYTALAGWALTLLLSVPLMLIFMRLTRLVQDAGGLARYAALAFGPAFGSAASLLIAATFALCIPAGTTMGAAYLQEIFHLPAWTVLPIVLGLLGISTLVNIAGAKPSRVVNTVAVLALVLLILAFVALNLPSVARGAAAVAEVAQGAVPIPLAGLWSASALLFWAFLGWENLSFGSEEYQDQPGFVSRVFLLGFVVVGVLYAALALVSTGAALSGKAIGGVTGLLRLVDGQPLRPVIVALIAVVVVANVNAWVFAASRLYFAAGRNGDLPAFLGRLDRRGIPVASLLLLFVLYAALAAAIAFEALPLVTALTVANQNFILLYAGAIATFVAVDKSASGRVIAAASAASCVFLLSGFGAWLAVPVLIGAIGYLKHRLAHRAAAPERAAS